MKDFHGELKSLKKKNLFRKLTYLYSAQGAKISLKRQKYINFSSNDYLGLSGHPEIVKTTVTALRKYGFGSGASRLLSGSYIPHKDLEQKIAKFKGTESALLFNSGFAANTGIIPALAETGYTVLSDELNHASIVDGIRLSKARTKIYRHADPDHLEKLLKRSSKKILIITDTVFSMDGDIAPLKDIVSLAGKYNAMLMIDDAHGSGVLGKTGRGGLEHFGIKTKDIVQMGTLSKAFGCFGGFAAGSKDLTDILINRSRSFIYSTSIPPAMAAACIKAIDIVAGRSARLRKKLWQNRQRLYQGLMDLGYETLNSETPIVPLLAGSVRNALKIQAHLYKKKVYAPAIRPPTVPEGKCRIRFSVTSAHTNNDIDMVLEILKDLR